jgi:hypothetical protein
MTAKLERAQAMGKRWADRQRPRARALLAGALMGAMLLAAGCSSPSKANIELRKQKQDLESQIAQLQRQHDEDQTTILELESHVKTDPTLPQNQLDQLYTAAGLKFGSATGGFRPDPNLPADTMLKVDVVPIDVEGDPIKAAGTFHIELFDLALASGNRIGQWDFDLQAAKSRWFGHAFLYTYVFDCPWLTAPTHRDLEVRVTFTDALTHRVIIGKRDLTVQLAK